MSAKPTTTKSEDVIKELKSLVVEVKYTEKNKSIKPKLDKSSIWMMAQKVGKHLSDDKHCMNDDGTYCIVCKKVLQSRVLIEPL